MVAKIPDNRSERREDSAVEHDGYRVVEQRLAFDDGRERLWNFEPSKNGDDGDRIGCTQNRAGQERRSERNAYYR